MAFQFTCPQGHLLEGDPAHVGMQSQCPMCGVMFIIPTPPGMEPQVQAAPDPEPAIGPFVPGPMNFTPPADPAPAAQDQPAVSALPAPTEEPAAPKEDPDRIVHILCPNNHELETPMSMVGTDAMCPHCETPFRLRYEDSREYREQKQKEREHREAVFSKKALNFAIIAAVLILGSLLGLMVLSAMNK